MFALVLGLQFFDTYLTNKSLYVIIYVQNHSNRVCKEENAMKIYAKILLLAAAFLTAAMLISCQKPAKTQKPPAADTSKADIEMIDPCAGVHMYVDGYCTECGKKYSSEGLEYKLSDDDRYYIVVGLGACTDKKITIPSYYNLKPVKEIADGAFSETKINEVLIPDTMTSIGECAFKNCRDLTSVNLPKSLTSIGKEAFFGCVSLSAKLEIPSKISAIEDGTFSGCGNVTSVMLPEGLTAIGNEAFSELRRIREITIPKNVTQIGRDAFEGCDLDKVHITSFNAWLAIEFENAASNPMFSLENEGAELVINGEAATSFVMGNEVKRIKSYTFAGCTSLINVKFSEKLEFIGEGAFYDCSLLQSAVLPDSLTYLGDSAFRGCTSLSNIRLPEALAEIKAFTFGGCDSVKSIKIPKSIRVIGKHSFYFCKKLSEIVYDGTLEEWGEVSKDTGWAKDTFNCKVCCTNGTQEINVSSAGLNYSKGGSNTLIVSGIGSCTDTEIHLAKEHEGKIIEGIGVGCFAGQKQITSVVIPDSVTSIADRAFADCSAIKSVTLPSSLTQISANVFLGCIQLTDIYFDGTKEDFNAIAKSERWYPHSGVFSVHCTNGDIEFGKDLDTSGFVFELSPNGDYYIVSRKDRCDLGDLVVIPGEYNGKPVKAIKKEGFKSLSATSVIIPEGIVRIEENAFDGASISYISIPSSMKHILKKAFDGHLTYVNITDLDSWCQISFDGLTSHPSYFGAGLLYNGAPLTSVKLGANVTRIGDYAFYMCDYITDVCIPFGVTHIGQYAFFECTSINKLELPNSLKSISNYAFAKCHGLSSVKIPSSVTYLSGYAFGGCATLSEMILPPNMTSFSGDISCSYLKALYIPKSIKNYGHVNPFQSCIRLTEIIYEGTTADWNKYLNKPLSEASSVHTVYCSDGLVVKGTTYPNYSLERQKSPDNTHYTVTGSGTCTNSIVIIDRTYQGLPVTEIADGAFEGASHSVIYIRDGITSIGSNAFKDCENLTYIRLPKTLKTIGENAFEGITDNVRITYGGTYDEWLQVSGSGTIEGVICSSEAS